MTTVEKSVDAAVPVSTAYHQWTQFESFPECMEGLDRVRSKQLIGARGQARQPMKDALRPQVLRR